MHIMSGAYLHIPKEKDMMIVEGIGCRAGPRYR